MLFVAIHTARDLAMGCVALVASHICVGTGVFLDLNALLLVTGQASRGKLTFQLQIKRRMGIRVAA